MIKSLVILALVLALAFGAFVSRPGQENFKSFAQQRMQQNASGTLDKVMATVKAESYLSDVQFKDRVLWTTVERDGKTVFTGAFSKWWGYDPALK